MLTFEQKLLALHNQLAVLAQATDMLMVEYELTIKPYIDPCKCDPPGSGEEYCRGNCMKELSGGSNNV